MINTDKYEGHTPADEWESHLIDALFETEFPMTYADNQLMADAPKLLAEVKRLQKENKILSKYMDIVQKYDDALLADGDTDPRWSELYD